MSALLANIKKLHCLGPCSLSGSPSRGCASASALVAFRGPTSLSRPLHCPGGPGKHQPCSALLSFTDRDPCAADIAEFVSFGEVGADQVPPAASVFMLLLTPVHTAAVGLKGSTCLQVDAASYYLLVAPQNMVGNTILTGMGEMVSCFTHSVFTCIQGRPGMQAASLENMPSRQASNVPRGADLQICSQCSAGKSGRAVCAAAWPAGLLQASQTETVCLLSGLPCPYLTVPCWILCAGVS